MQSLYITISETVNDTPGQPLLSERRPMINVYVQLSHHVQKCATFTTWTDRAQQKCQDLANRFRREVRAMNDNDRKILGVFHPKGNQRKS